MKKKIWIPLLILAVLVLAISLRLRPRTLEQVTGFAPDDLTGLSTSAREGGVSNGEFYSDYYKTASLTPEDEAFFELLALVDPLRFRPSLWPFPRDSVNTNSLESLSLLLTTGEDFSSLSIYDNGKVLMHVSGGFLIYYLADLEPYDPLFSYIKTHGEKT